jgi:bifunctional ADP-heptose synthase (sugar kinase/adenylyltransferase)
MPLALIQSIRPHVLVKGGDYRVDQVVGREFVVAQGGRVVLVPLVPGQSTTRFAEGLRACLNAQEARPEPKGSS